LSNDACKLLAEKTALRSAELAAADIIWLGCVTDGRRV